MTSVPGVGGEVKTRNAVSKLVKIPGRDVAEPNGNTLYEKLLQKAVDLAYEDVFTRTRGQEAKLSLLKAYVQQPEAYTSKSGWFRDAICALNVEIARIDRKRKPADPLKDTIANIKAQSPRISHRKICSKLDVMKISLPQRYWRSSDHSWAGAFYDQKIRRRLKSYFSKIKRSATQL
jgi:hypothetical protein